MTFLQEQQQGEVIGQRSRQRKLIGWRLVLRSENWRLPSKSHRILKLTEKGISHFEKAALQESFMGDGIETTTFCYKIYIDEFLYIAHLSVLPKGQKHKRLPTQILHLLRYQRMEKCYKIRNLIIAKYYFDFIVYW